LSTASLAGQRVGEQVDSLIDRPIFSDPMGQSPLCREVREPKYASRFCHFAHDFCIKSGHDFGYFDIVANLK